MSFFPEIVEGLTEDAGEAFGDDAAGAGAEAGEAAEGANAASEAIDSTIIDGIDGAGEEVEGGGTIEQETQEGMKESQEEVKDVVEKLEKGEAGAAEDAKALEDKLAKGTKDPWANAKKFGKFVGGELAKGALMAVGMQAAQIALAKLLPLLGVGPGAGNNSGPSGGAATAADDPRVKMIQAINQAGKILQDALNTWLKWQAANYANRESYGNISVEGMDIQLFQVLQNKVASLGDQRDKLAPLLKTVQQTKTLDAVKALLTADIAYAQAVVDTSNQISAHMTAMTDAGLPTKAADVQAAYSILVAANT
ncbi:hypothetical protein B0H66DRAFT_529002 [Apodospora peruviana]|uniref:Uncharacterized protein n=1 Tax=Apodospora peruviana TaxID=516989 RepID=A0AAE0MAX0_9PEZI|nr:hypothetical protein B0H66DRAFT_529002 [Apodospora peruviana]